VLGIVVGMPVFFGGAVPVLSRLWLRRASQWRAAGSGGMPLLAGLSVVHGTLPPHPAAMLAGDDNTTRSGRTILLGLASGLPACRPGPVPGLGWF